MKFLLLLVFAIAVFAVDSRYSSRSKHKIRVSSDGDQDPDTHQNQKIFHEEPVSTIVDEAQKLKDLGNDELGPPISPEEFAKARNDSTLTAPPPDGGKAIEESGEYQGDIKLTPKQRAHMRKGRIATWALTDETSRLWENGIIPYTIASVFNERERQVIARAMEEFHDRTCLRFVGRTSQPDYYHILSGNGCSSHLGHYEGKGQHNLTLSRPNCVTFGIVIHEFMHAAGFWHEQNRNDRDNYISINRENVIDKYLFALEKDPNVYGLGLPYDYQSVMHYSTHAFSKNGQPTITVKEEGVTIGQRNGFSELDVKGINIRYQCEEGGSCVVGVSIGSQCLVFNQDAHSTWEEAKSSCEAVGMKLASLADPATVLEYIKETYGSVDFYVGGTDNATEGTWKWLNGQPISSDSSIFPWANGEPNNYPPNGDEDCLTINFRGGFNDEACWFKKPYICEVVQQCPYVSIGGQCLWFSDFVRNWEQAKSYCEDMGTKLASLADPFTVLHYVQEEYGGLHFFVGGSDAAEEGTWKWLNGQPISSDSSIFPWANGEPNNYPPNGDEDCLTINFAGGFNDEACRFEDHFICEVV